MDSIFQRYGGFAVVSRIVGDFYDRVLDSDVLRPFFANRDMRVLIDHQTKFIASMMGGPASYTDEHLKRVHANLGIGSSAFDEAVLILKETLEDHGMDATDVGVVAREVESRRQIIVTEP